MSPSASSGDDARSSALGRKLALVARTAVQRCGADDALIFQAEDDQLRLVAKFGSIRTARRVGDTVAASRVLYGVAFLKRRTLHIRDLAVAVRTRFRNEEWAALQRATGVRTLLAVPLVLDGVAAGVMVIRRTRVRQFVPHEIALLESFAEQAALTIENAADRRADHP